MLAKAELGTAMAPQPFFGRDREFGERFSAHAILPDLALVLRRFMSREPRPQHVRRAALAYACTQAGARELFFNLEADENESNFC